MTIFKEYFNYDGIGLAELIKLKEVSIEDVLETVVSELSPPTGEPNNKLKAMLVDSWYDAYLGVVILVRVIDGSIKKGMEVKFHATNSKHLIERVGTFNPKMTSVDEIKISIRKFP